jgi:hypothetical protein
MHVRFQRRGSRFKDSGAMQKRERESKFEAVTQLKFGVLRLANNLG